MEEYEVDLRDYIKIVIDKKWLILGIMLACVVVAGIYVSLQPSHYETRATILVASTPGVSELNGGSSVDLGLSPAVYEKLLMTNDVLEEVIINLELEIAVEDLRGALSAQVEEVTSGKDSLPLPLITLTVKGNNPEKIKQIADMWVEVSVNKSRETISSHTAQSYQYLQELYDTTDADLKTKQDEKLEKMKGESLAVAKDGLVALSSTYTREINQLYKDKESLETSKTKLNSLKTFSASSSIDKSLQLQLAVEQGVYTSLSDYKNAQQVAVDTLKHNVDFLEENTEKLSEEIHEKEQEVEELRIYYNQLNTDINSLKKTRDRIFDKLQEAKLAQSIEASSVRIVENPVTPQRPANPNLRFKLVIAAVAWLVIGVFVAFFKHYISEDKKK